MAALRPVPAEQFQAQKQGFSRTTLLVLLVFLPFLIQALAYLKLLLHCIVVRNDTGYPEGASVYAFLTPLQTGNLYSDPFHFPLNVQLYGPLFYIIGTALAKVAHGDPLLTAELMRMLSLLSFIGSVVLIGYLSRRLERQKYWTATCVVLSFACAWSIPYVASARPESLCIFFIFAALTVYEVAEGRSKTVFWVGVLGSLAFLVKQSAAPVMFALLLDSLIARRLRNTAAMVAGSLPIPSVILLVLWLRHEPFLANFTGVGQAIINWPDGLSAALNLLRTNQLAIIPIGVALVGAGLCWKKKRYRAILLAAVFGSFTNIAALANLGGYKHYLILPWLLMIPMIPAGLIQIEKWAQRSFLIPVGLTLLGMFLLVHQRELLTQQLPADIDASIVSKLEVLSDLPYLEMYSRQPALLDPFYYHDLYLQNRWSYAPITQRINNEEYDLVLLTGEDGHTDSAFSVEGFRGVSYWGADILEEIETHYQVLCEVPQYLAFVPRDRSTTVRGEEIGSIFHQPCRVSNRKPQLSPGLR